MHPSTQPSALAASMTMVGNKSAYLAFPMEMGTVRSYERLHVIAASHNRHVQTLRLARTRSPRETRDQLPGGPKDGKQVAVIEAGTRVREAGKLGTRLGVEGKLELNGEEWQGWIVLEV
jgi:hypothetical protein